MVEIPVCGHSGGTLHTIDTCDSLKRELCSQFFPDNAEILARRKLRELKHTGTIQEYVKEFAGLMLDVSDMTEKDKIFSFVEGLKPWAMTKLYKQKVQDLASAYALAERLFDLSGDSQETRRHQSSYLEETGTADRILLRLLVKIEVPIETASLSNPIRGTPEKDMIVQTRRIVLPIAIYVMDHIGQGNAWISRPSMPFRPLWLRGQMAS